MQNDHVRQGTTCGEVVCSGVSHASHPKGAERQRSPIFGFSCIYVYTFDIELPNTACHVGGGACF